MKIKDTRRPFRTKQITVSGPTTYNMTTPVTLRESPIYPMEAVHKLYVDNKALALDANGIVDGILNAARLPNFSGDVLKSAGSTTTSLNNTGVTAGTYTKITVNGSGRVTGGVAKTTITSVPWTKITTGKPTTLSGYGITDALTKSGGKLTGKLKLTKAPTADNHAVNKGWCRSTAIAGMVMWTGDVVSRPSTTTPSGFLRCNGATLSTTTYADLFNVIKYKFGGSGSSFRIPNYSAKESRGFRYYIKI